MTTSPANLTDAYADSRRSVALDLAPRATPGPADRPIDRTRRWLIERFRAMRVDRPQHDHLTPAATRPRRSGPRPVARTELDVFRHF